MVPGTAGVPQLEATAASTQPSNIVLGAAVAPQTAPNTVRRGGAVDGDIGGSFVSLAAGTRPAAAENDEPATPQHTSRPSKEDTGVPTIKWDNSDDDAAENLASDPAAGSPAWLDDFLNHLGQTEAQRNPNAGIRVRVPVAAGHV